MVASIVCVIKSCLILRYSSMTRTCFLWCLKRAELTVLHQWGKRRKVVIHNPQFKNYIIRANYRFYFCCFKKALHARWPVFMPFFSGLTKGRPFQALDFTLEGAEQFPSGNGHFYEKNVLEPCWVPVRHCGGCSGLFRGLKMILIGHLWGALTFLADNHLSDGHFHRDFKFCILHGHMLCFISHSSQ